MHILDTPRLSLRWFAPADADFVRALVNDPDWLRHIGPRDVHTPQQAAAWIENNLVAHYRQHGMGLWAVQRRSDAALMGMCGLVCRDFLEAPDVGYAFLPAHRGQGYAREAAQACLQHAASALGLPRVLAIVKPGNAASVRVLEAIGMQPLGERLLPGAVQASLVWQWAPPQ